jgi:cytochrome c-type biogenesis protein CcmE
MKNKGLKIGLTSLVLALTFGGLLYTTMAEGTEYYKHVDEVMTQPDQWYGKKLQLHGFVVPDSISQARTRWTTGSRSRATARSSSATYTGVVPDTFKSDSEVVLKGTLSREGFTVQPNGVMAKCPSKYEAKPGSAALREILEGRMASLGALLLCSRSSPRPTRSRLRRRRAAPQSASSKARSARSTPSPRS